MTVRSLQSKKLREILLDNGIAVIPTDTMYGIVGRALSEAAVERVYAVRSREKGKPCIILIADESDLKRFALHPSARMMRIISSLWPGPFSIIFRSPSRKYAYLHRGEKTLALRMPRSRSLRALIRFVGPLIAPSANTAGELPARSVREARKYFGSSVDCYVDTGIQKTQHSTILSVSKKGIVVVRDGGHPIPKEVVWN